MQTNDPERILAVDIRPQSMGFVVFEGARLLDWGVKRFPRGVNAVRIPPRPKLGALIIQYVPDAFVLNRPRTGSEEMLREARLAAKAHDVAVSILSAQAVKRAFLAHSNKDERATAIAGQFPELLSLLPPKRKIWESEDYRMKIFDAAAIGIAYFTEKAAGVLSHRVQSEPFQRPLRRSQ